MSIAAITWAFGVRLQDVTAKAVLLALANQIRKDGHPECWPSIATLAKHSGCAERTVQRTLRRLEKIGLISIHREPWATNLYLLHIDWEPLEMSGELPVENDSPTTGAEGGRGDNEVLSPPSTEADTGDNDAINPRQGVTPTFLNQRTSYESRQLSRTELVDGWSKLKAEIGYRRPGDEP